jgi:hypothetical protein
VIEAASVDSHYQTLLAKMPTDTTKPVTANLTPAKIEKAIKSSKVECAVNSFEILTREWGSKKVET